MPLEYRNMWNGLYTYNQTVEDSNTNTVKNVVRVQVNQDNTGKVSIPVLPIDKSTVYNNIEFNILLNDDKITGKNEEHRLELGGILMYDGSSDLIVVTLIVTFNDKIFNISGNPRHKKYKKLSIKLSGISQGQAPRISPWIGPGGIDQEGISSQDIDRTGVMTSEEGQFITSGESMVTPENAYDIDDALFPYGPPTSIIPEEESEIITPNVYDVTDTDQYEKSMKLPKSTEISNINAMSPKDINALLNANHIEGQGSADSYCTPEYPYVFGANGDGCCISKPMQVDANSPKECDISGSRGYGLSVPCKNPPCFDNPNIQYGNTCPPRYPYSHKGSRGGQNGTRIWGGDGFFCCKSNPGKGENCPAGSRAVCPFPQCSTDYKSLQFLENKDSIICSQMIGNRHQIGRGGTFKIITNFNPTGIPVTPNLVDSWNKAYWITFSTDKISKSYTSKLLIVKQIEDFGFIKLTDKNNNVINIDAEFKKYIGNLVNKYLYITPTLEDMTTCKSNNKPLYPIVDELGRDFEYEWSSMGSMTVSDSFISKNVNTNNLTQEILDKKLPYMIYKSNTSGVLYFYDKSKIPVDCTSPESCRETCSGFIKNKVPYFQQCGSDPGTYNMYCSANPNYKKEYRECESNPGLNSYAVPMPTCPDTNRFSYNRGKNCCAFDLDANGMKLTDSSDSCWNNQQIECANPPCCPYSNPDAFSEGKTRLCATDLNNPNSKNFACSPSGVSYGKPPCSEPYIVNTCLKDTPDSIIKTKITNDPVRCRKYCKETAGCGVYDIQGNKCTLRGLEDIRNLKEDKPASECNGRIAGYVIKSPVAVGKAIHGDDIQGAAPLNNVTSPAECRTRCAEFPECNAYEYWSNNRTCWLKNKNLNNLNVTENSTYTYNAVSGIMTANDNLNQADSGMRNPDTAVNVAGDNLEGFRNIIPSFNKIKKKQFRMVQENLKNRNKIIPKKIKGNKYIKYNKPKPHIIHINREEFKTAIDNIMIKPNIEHLTQKEIDELASRHLNTENAKKINNICKPDPEGEKCKNLLTDLFPYGYDNQDDTTQPLRRTYHPPNVESCPMSHPYSFNSGLNCSSQQPKPYGEMKILWSPKAVTVKCPAKNKICGDNLSVPPVLVTGKNEVLAPK